MKPSLEGNFYPTNRKGEVIKTAAFHLYFSLSHPGSQADGENALWLPLLYFIIIYAHLGHFPYLSSSSLLCLGGGEVACCVTQTTGCLGNALRFTCVDFMEI